MAAIFLVRHKQPKDIPFTKSASHKQIKGLKYQNTCKLTTIVVIICMSTLYYGLCLSMISAVNVKAYSTYFGTWAGESSTIGLLIGFFPIGGAIGAVCARFFLQKFTRKQILLILDIVAIVVTGLLQIPNIGLLLALRIIQGFIVGVFMAVVPSYVNQLVPLDLHGSQGVISQILIVVGVVIDYFFKAVFTATAVDLHFYWRFVFAFSGVPIIIQIICLALNIVPESPMSLIQRGKMQQARVILAEYNVPQALNDVLAEMTHESKKNQLQKIAKQFGVTHEKSKKQFDAASEKASSDKNVKDIPALPAPKPKPRQSINLNSSNQLMKDNLDNNGTNRILSSILLMYAKDLTIHPEVNRILSDHHIQFEPVPYVEPKPPKKGIFLGFQLHFMQQFSGIKMVITQVGVLFTKYNATLSLYTPLIANICQLIATCVSICILSRYGRRKPTIIGNLTLSIINFVLAGLFLGHTYNPTESLIYTSFAFILLFMIAYALSIGPVVWPYVPELMPIKYVPFASSMNWIAAAICTIATPYILDAVGSPYPVFFFFGGILLIFLALNMRLLVETKGLTPSQVAAQLQK